MNNRTLSWNPPVNDGNFPIKYYRVSTNDEYGHNMTSWKTNELRFILPTLTFNKIYQIFVTATNDIGESAASNIISWQEKGRKDLCIFNSDRKK